MQILYQVLWRGGCFNNGSFDGIWSFAPLNADSSPTEQIGFILLIRGGSYIRGNFDGLFVFHITDIGSNTYDTDGFLSYEIPVPSVDSWWSLWFRTC